MDFVSFYISAEFGDMEICFGNLDENILSPRSDFLSWGNAEWVQ
jgi:hypothetical protein